MPTVYLHVGATKTGTTYIQSVLTRNRGRLRRRGVLWPGQRWRDQVRATNDLLGRDLGRGAPDVTGAWDRLAEEIRAWDGESAIVSMEFLSFADEATARRAVESLAPHRVRVVVTGRDLLRVIPAIWQESVQNGHTLQYRAYLDRLTAADYHGARTGVPAGFWGQQDLARMLRSWQPAVAAEDLVLVTVPPPGADRSLLWTRFCESVDLNPRRLRPGRSGNESLGATSAELMRRANVRAKRADADWSTVQALKWRVAKRRLSGRKSDEPTLVLPRDYYVWVAEQQQHLTTAIRQVNPVVVGDLEDLLYAADPSAEPPPIAPGTVAAPAHIPADQLLDAALDAIVGLAQDVGASSTSGTGSVGLSDDENEADDEDDDE